MIKINIERLLLELFSLGLLFAVQFVIYIIVALIYEQYASSLIHSCDFTAGGGSINLCSNDKLIIPFYWSVGIGIPIVFVINSIIRFVLKRKINPAVNISTLFHLAPLFWTIIFFFFVDPVLPYGEDRSDPVGVSLIVAFITTILFYIVWFVMTSIDIKTKNEYIGLLKYQIVKFLIVMNILLIPAILLIIWLLANPVDNPDPLFN